MDCPCWSIAAAQAGCSGWFFALFQNSKPRKPVPGCGRRGSLSMPSCTKVRPTSSRQPSPCALHILKSGVSIEYPGGAHKALGEETTKRIDY